MNYRRKLIVALGAGVLTVPFALFAQQQGKIWRIGVLMETEPSYYSDRLEWFKTGLRDLGYAEGKDYVIEQRSADTDYSRLPLVAELLALKVDLIVAPGTPAAVAARNATREIPILFVGPGNPVGSGLAASLRHPGGNVTGLTNLSSDIITKRLDLLRQILPDIRRVGFLYNPDNSSSVLNLRQFESDCAKFKFNPIPAPARKVEEIAAAFNKMKRDKAQGMIVIGGATLAASRVIVVNLAAKHRLPVIYGQIDYIDAGGLISYAPNLPDLWRRAANYADKIFKGAKPSDLPIEQPVKFDLVLNMKTAKALGIKIPGSVLVQANKVIE